MSTPSDRNNFLSDSSKQKTINFEEFDHLFEINKFTEPILNSSTSRNSISNEVLQKNSIGRNDINRKFNPISRAINLPAGKDHKIENFNIYNKCIFFVNSDDHKSVTKPVKITKVLPNNKSEFEQAPKIVNSPTRSLDNQEDNCSKNSDDPNIISESIECLEKEPESKCLELYTAVDNELKRIEAPLGSSGVYKKVPLNGEKNFITTSIKQKPNVFYSSTERNGKIIPDHVFKNSYVLLDSDSETALENNKDENNFNVVLTDESSEKDSLNILAYDILKLSNSDDFIIDRKNQQIICREPKINKKTIYRMIKPESLGLTKQIFDSLEPVKDKKNVQSLLKPSFLNKKRGRPRKTQNKETISHQIPTSNTIEKSNFSIKNSSTPAIITRFGRTTKRPTHIPTTSPNKCSSNELENRKLLQSIVFDLKDPDYKCNKPLPNLPQEQSPKQDEPPIKRERNLPSEYICQTCNKVFLGRRMQRHYMSHPDHKKSTKETSSQSSPPEDMSLYKFLVNKVNQVSESNDKKVEVFLNEISDLANQLQARTSRLIYNTSGMHYINMQSSKLLGVPEGHYTLDINAINSPSESSMQLDTIIRSPAPPQSRMDYNLSMSLDDTLNDTKLNLSDNLAPSEESLLRTVEDLVKEGIKKLSEGNCDSMDNSHHQPHNINPQVIHYDHASDNAVEAVSMKETQIHTQPILDLSLDLFQFSN